MAIIIIIIILQLVQHYFCLPTAYQCTVIFAVVNVDFYLYIRILLKDFIRLLCVYSICKISLILIKLYPFFFPLELEGITLKLTRKPLPWGLTPTILEDVRQATMIEKHSIILPSCKIYKPKNDQQDKIISRVQ